MSRNIAHWGRAGAVVLLATIIVAGVALAHASPPDPTWISGLWDDADHDDAIIALLGIDGFVVTVTFFAQPTALVAPLVLGDVPRAPAHELEALRTRAPPHVPRPA